MRQLKTSPNRVQIATKSKKVTSVVVKKPHSINDAKITDLQKVIIRIDSELDELAAKDTIAPKTEYLRKVFANSKISG